MKIVAKTDTGRVRSSNQDSYAAGEFPDGVAWAVVCDGMGGTSGGSVASSAAVRTISEQISAAYRPGMPESSLKNMLVTAITNANYSIFDLAEKDPSLKGMGTTVVAAVVRPDAVYIAHAGDSRAYMLSTDGIKQLTKDHSVVQAMVENGEITKQQAANHPSRNLITRALGVDEDVRIDFTQADLQSSDILLICTDGLTNYADDQAISGAVSDGKYSEYADRLVDLANSNGGGDNITVVVIAL
jgi:serine/threonine protein phosphatase PrpC